MKRSMRLVALTALAVPALAVSASAATISSVRLKAKTKTTVSPKVTVVGSGFGTQPTSFSAAQTSCGAYGKGNGAWYGEQAQKNLWFVDHNNVDPFEWDAGIGTQPSNGSCVGIVLKKWSDTEVVFKFGKAYGSFSNWTVFKGDEFEVAVAGATTKGTAS
jgi:hypothetical protein